VASYAGDHDRFAFVDQRLGRVLAKHPGATKDNNHHMSPLHEPR
jgi:hypothetical protein